MIYDIGAHNGDDTEYYLKKGYNRVVAVEANPTFFNYLQQRFYTEVSEGKLTILSAALVPSDYLQSTITLHIDPDHLDWSSLISDRAKSYVEHIEVPTINIGSLYDKYGVPEFLKMDIEATEQYILEDIHLNKYDVPKYISVEASSKENLPLLKKLGYTKFKWSNQNNKTWQCTYPSKHGNYYQPPVWSDCCSGPFGEDLQGEWVGYKTIERIYQLESTKSFWGDIHGAK